MGPDAISSWLVVVEEEGGEASFIRAGIPVLSKMMAEILWPISRAAPPLMRMPLLAPMPVPTMTAVGVARPSAHGQAITTTDRAKRKAKTNLFDPLSREE